MYISIIYHDSQFGLFWLEIDDVTPIVLYDTTDISVDYFFEIFIHFLFFSFCFSLFHCSQRTFVGVMALARI